MLPVEDEPASALEVATWIVEPPEENSCPESVSTSLRTRSFTTTLIIIQRIRKAVMHC